jgi:hypothetical protein
MERPASGFQRISILENVARYLMCGAVALSAVPCTAHWFDASGHSTRSIALSSVQNDGPWCFGNVYTPWMEQCLYKSMEPNQDSIASTRTAVSLERLRLPTAMGARFGLSVD